MTTKYQTVDGPQMRLLMAIKRGAVGAEVENRENGRCLVEANDERISFRRKEHAKVIFESFGFFCVAIYHARNSETFDRESWVRLES